MLRKIRDKFSKLDFKYQNTLIFIIILIPSFIPAVTPKIYYCILLFFVILLCIWYFIKERKITNINKRTRTFMTNINNETNLVYVGNSGHGFTTNKIYNIYFKMSDNAFIINNDNDVPVIFTSFSHSNEISLIENFVLEKELRKKKLKSIIR